MSNIIHSIGASLEGGQYYTAFVTALCLPDMCGYLDYPSAHTKDRYMGWFEKYMPQYLPMVSAAEAYALRCVVLHNATQSTAPYVQRSKPNHGLLLDKFLLSTETSSHLNKFTDIFGNGVKLADSVQLNVGQYCRDMLDGVARWEKDKEMRLEEYPDALSFYEDSINHGSVRIT